MSATPLTVHALRTYFALRPYAPEVVVDCDGHIWQGDTPYVAANPADFLTAWALRDLVIEAFTGESATMGREIAESLANAAEVDDGAIQFDKLKHDLRSSLSVFMSAMRRRMYGGRDIWPEQSSRADDEQS